MVEAAERTAGATAIVAPTQRPERRLRVGLVVVLAVQAAWVAVLCGRGWFYQDDLGALDVATGRSLDWGYLTEPVNDHLVPGYRLVFWLLEHTSPLAHTSTVVARVVLQSLAVFLLWRLLVLLCGERPGVLVVTALYAVNPLIICNITWLTTAACLVPAQLAAVLAVHHHVRHTVTGRLRDAAYAGLALLLGMCFWEKTAIIGLFLPLLSLGYLTGGPARARIRSVLARWRGWLLTAVPPLLFVVYFVTHHYGGSARGITAGQLGGVVGTAWWHTVGPAMLGGPWTWTSSRGVYVSFTAPPVWVSALAQVLLAALLVAGWRRTRARSLWAWSLPLVSIVVGTGMVALGRYQDYGNLLATTIRYCFDVTFALALGAALALLPSSAAAIAERAGGRDTVPADAPVEDATRSPSTRFARIRAIRVPFPRRSWPALRPRRARALLGVVTAALLVVTLGNAAVSALRFEHRWTQDPTHPYVDRLTREVRAAGPTANLYDTSVSPAVLPAVFGPTMLISRLLGWTGTEVDFDRTDVRLLLADERGNLHPANILPASRGAQPAANLCAIVAHGRGTWRLPLVPTLPGLVNGFLRLEYLQRDPSVLRIYLQTADGHLVAPLAGARTSLPVTLGATLLRVEAPSAVAVVFRSESLANHVCLGHVVVGAPFRPAGR
ncbi:hypothetical protein SAMN05443575_0384 [Jatrophihabitans endophyticus]|uniref:Glycosyltransferase RgtA/B/C/D-like domain-containing protein n=1 Tax=Jatrophihabitans endophyticus TaxID=1206085 RepID=A0A1M5CXI4_9ACTN|nr:hypothetical protein [Jatrophihabitans endophyticus]SHF59202.1 hypothetical protein SAMN05443575_0384 [Jatrophihabitans endophyticus]